MVSSISRVRAVFVLMAVGWYTLDEIYSSISSIYHQYIFINIQGFCVDGSGAHFRWDDLACTFLPSSAFWHLLCIVQDIDHPRYFSLSDIILYTLYWAVALFLHGIFLLTMCIKFAPLRTFPSYCSLLATSIVVSSATNLLRFSLQLSTSVKILPPNHYYLTNAAQSG